MASLRPATCILRPATHLVVEPTPKTPRYRRFPTEVSGLTKYIMGLIGMKHVSYRASTE